MTNNKPYMNRIYLACSDIDYMVPLKTAFAVLVKDDSFIEADIEHKVHAVAELATSLANINSLLRFKRYEFSSSDYIASRIDIAYQETNPHLDVKIVYDPYTDVVYYY
jgi:hypothetical protein